jgi:pentalenene oxygenase
MAEQFVMAEVPGRLPLAGHAMPLLFRPLEFLRALPSFGDLVRLQAGPREVFVPCHRTLFRQVLKEARDYDKGGLFYDRGRETVGNSLVTCRWDDHQRQRPLMQPSFDHGHISRYAGLIADEVDAMTRTWRPGDVVELERAMGSLTLRITTRALFAVSADHRSVAQVERWLPVLMAGFYRRLVVPGPLLSLVPTRANRHYPRAITELRDVAEEFVDEVRAKGGQDSGLLAALLDARDEETGAPLSAGEIHDQAIALLIAGSETTAKALGFVFYLLGRHPEVEAALRDEADAVLGGRTPGFEDLSRLSYTRQVVMEALRLYPPGWIFSRSTTAACELGGHAFPAGTMFLLSPYILHHDPHLFADPEAFDPDRWRPGGMDAESRRAVLPFGFGAHKCIGDQFALTEAILAVAMIMTRWRLRPLDDRPLRPVPRATLGPGRLRMWLQARRGEPRRGHGGEAVQAAAAAADDAEGEAGRS